MALLADEGRAQAQPVRDGSSQPRASPMSDQPAHAPPATVDGDDDSSGHPAPAALPALFWDTMPAGDSQHPDKLAMDAMMEELSAAERAANFKVIMRSCKQT